MSKVKLQNELKYWQERTTLVLDKENAKAILSVDETLDALGYAPLTRESYIMKMVQFVQFVKKPIAEIRKEDLIKYLSHKKKIKDSTKWVIYQKVKGFFNHYNPELDMHIEFPKRSTKEPNDHYEWVDKLPTQEEIEKLLQYASSTRDQAFIAILVESGARIREVLRMMYKDVQVKEKYLKITLRGRKKQRDVPIVWGAKYVMRWLDDHHTKKLDDPLWLYVYKGRSGHLNYHGGFEVIKKTAKRAGIKKKLTPHIFRHLRSTLLAKDPTLSTQIKKRLLGHSKSSTTFERVYEHLSDQDVIESVLVGHGLKEAQKSAPQLKAKYCPRCSTPVSQQDKYCANCFFVLDQEIALQEEERQKELIEKLIENKVYEIFVEGRIKGATSKNGEYSKVIGKILGIKEKE
jgi:site-specific recombinase XerD